MGYATQLCVHCGEKTKGKYCKRRGTAQGRRDVDAENAKIKEENLKKGFKYSK